MTIVVLGQEESVSSYLCLPFREIKEISPKLYELFEKFVDLFSDHPDEDNTYLIFLYSGGRGRLSWRVFFVCTHFEHNSFEDVPLLVKFMSDFAEHFGGNPIYDVFVNTINGNGEFLILELYLTWNSVPRWVKRMIRGYRTNPRAFRLVFA